jgi:cytochrome c peroxidase
MVTAILTIGAALGFASAVISILAAEGSTRGRHSFHRHTHRHQPAPPEGDPSEVTVGERLFLETRFAQFFAEFIAAGGDVNVPLLQGDPVMDFSITTDSALPGPFAGGSMNCRACHLVDEQVDGTGNGMRTYNDFARRSPIPDRGDGHVTAPRNSPPLVNASLPRDEGLLFHFDGEFATLSDLVRSTITGRNYGWLPREGSEAIANLARVIREDDGRGELALEFGGLSYQRLLTGTDAAIPAEFRLPRAFRVDVKRASDTQIFDAVAALVATYTEHLEFSVDEDGNFTLSPFDVFLAVNHLPQQPRPDESAGDYSRRLLERVNQLDANGAIQFVTSNPNTASGGFDFHPGQPFWFSTDELRGLKIFLSEPPALPLTSPQLAAGGIGNCIACHPAPRFTDFRLHNTGATQLEYDAIHGAGAFANLPVPDLATRNADPDAYLPATAGHPDATGRFRAVPDARRPDLTDLGVWNVFANPDFPQTQRRLLQLLCDEELGRRVPAGLLKRCEPSSLLSRTIALFKTAGLRDLSHSAPYIHNGQFDTLEEVIELYRTTSSLQRAHALRNGADELAGIALAPDDLSSLVAFLRSLNEDYQ